ncbi:hypothetical protein [Blastomonas sp.]|uniref:hypothetical protein n=1 Tax=Blastomonas sp. TaxID=1909299 RepID=UPI0035947371
MSHSINRRSLVLASLTLPLVTFISAPALATTVRVGSAAELDRALVNASAGTTIILRSGVTFSKSGSFSIGRSGTSSAPIRIVAERNLATTMRSNLTLNGDNVQVVGLRFDNAGVNINRNNCQVSTCIFTGTNGRVSLDGAVNAVINNNEFSGWGERCISFDPFNNGQGRNPRIYGNYFHDGRNVCIALGFQHRHQPLNIGAVIESNLFVNCTHDQVINAKSSGNRIRGNTMIGGGAFVCRFGLNNTFENNWMENCKGIWLSDKNCVASGNRLNNSDLQVLAGDVTSAQTASREGSHPRSESARLTNNVARRTTIGAWGSLTLPAINTVVEGHNGRIDRGREQGTQIKSTGNSSAGSAARKLSTGQVGPGAAGATPAPAASSSSSSSSGQTNDQPSNSSNSSGSGSSSNTSSSGLPSINGHECVGDPATILKGHKGQNAWVVSEQYHKKAIDYFEEMRKYPSGSNEYKTYRTLYAACRDVNQLADSMARSGVRTL